MGLFFGTDRRKKCYLTIYTIDYKHFTAIAIRESLPEQEGLRQVRLPDKRNKLIRESLPEQEGLRPYKNIQRDKR